MIDLLIRRARLTPAGRELAGAHLSAVGPVDIHIDSGRFTAVAAHAGSAPAARTGGGPSVGARPRGPHGVRPH